MSKEKKIDSKKEKVKIQWEKKTKKNVETNNDINTERNKEKRIKM